MPCTITIDLATKKVTQSGDVAIRESVVVTVVNLGGSAPADLRMAVLNGETVIATASAFVASGDDAVGTMSLAGTAALALFTADSGALDKRDLYWTLWDVTLKALRVNDQITIHNNVFTTTLTAPTPV